MTPLYVVNYLVTVAWRSIPRVHRPAVGSQVRSTHDAEAIATLDVAVALTLPRRLVEPGDVPRSCMPNDVQRVADAQLRDDTNRRQFHVALLENCSFFAHLVLRHVRAEGNRNSPRKKRSVAKVSQTPPQPTPDILPRQLPVEERALPPEMPSSLLQILWVEVGRRHVQTLVSGKGVS